jgi:hypothetical protein
LLTVAALALLGVGGAGATGPSPFHLVFEGRHNSQLLHEGTFTTSSPWCPSGSAADVSIDESTLTAVRLFSCAAGADFTAKVSPLSAEHGGNGSWQIVAGSGPLADLRGKGTFSSVRTGGDPNDPATITFRSTWDGVADFDVAPPVIGLMSWRARKLHPSGTYKVRLALSLTDAGGGRVVYDLEVVDPKRPANLIAYKTGTANGSVIRTFRIKVAKRRRAVRLEVDASDAVGNESALVRTVRLR